MTYSCAKMRQSAYKQFCPIAMASEVLCTRWTVPLLRELIAGSTRFNDLRRGVPKMSPTLLSRRLKELEEAGVIERRAVRSARGVFEYRMTESGEDLRTVVEAIGSWGQKWIDKKQSLKNLDPSFLMWDMRRKLKATPPPDRRTVIQFLYPELPLSRRSYWLVVEPHGEVDLCSVDPGFEVDLYVSADLRAMTAIWLGLTTLERERTRVRFTGTRAAAQKMQAWLGLDRARAAAGVELPRLPYAPSRGRTSGDVASPSSSRR
jgi:DNA-binding HxlR family transcriptional regulator